MKLEQHLQVSFILPHVPFLLSRLLLFLSLVSLQVRGLTASLLPFVFFFVPSQFWHLPQGQWSFESSQQFVFQDLSLFRWRF